MTSEGNLKYAQLNQTRELTPWTLKRRITGTERVEVRAVRDGWIEEGIEGGVRQGYRSQERDASYSARGRALSVSPLTSH